MRPVAVGRRVLLRHPTVRDRDEFLALTRTSRPFHRPWGAPPTTPARYAAWLRRYRRPEQVALLVCRRTDGRVIGVFTLMEIVRGSFHSAYLGYWAGAPFARQGYMREGMALVVRHAFTRLRLHRLEANIQPDNRRSKALARRCGFEREGFSRRYLKIGGRWRDHERWALLAETWRRATARGRKREDPARSMGRAPRLSVAR